MDDLQRAKGEALAFFLCKEQLRHLEDIEKIEDDLDILEAKGIQRPLLSEIDVKTWIEP